MANVEQMIKQFEEQLSVEKKAVDMTKRISENAESPLVRHLITAIGFDSMKHQSYCKALIDIFSGTKLLVRERVDLIKQMEAHMKLEKEMIEQLQKIIKQTDHPAAKFMLREYEADEKRHHSILKKLMDQKFIDKPHEDIIRHIYTTETIFGPR